MNIELKKITIRELTEGYEDNDENGVVGFGGKLDIRPPYQREFVYKDKQRDAVIDTITKDFPLNVMYWAVREDGNFEVIDGQQRTISISQFIDGDFSVKIGNFPENRAFHNLQKDEKEQIRSAADAHILPVLPMGHQQQPSAYDDKAAHEDLRAQRLRGLVYRERLLAGLFHIPDTDSDVHEALQL